MLFETSDHLPVVADFEILKPYFYKKGEFILWQS